MNLRFSISLFSSSNVEHSISMHRLAQAQNKILAQTSKIAQYEVWMDQALEAVRQARPEWEQDDSRLAFGDKLRIWREHIDLKSRSKKKAHGPPPLLPHAAAQYHPL